MNLDNIRWEHVLGTLIAGLVMLVGGALLEQSWLQQLGLTIVFFGALVYLFIRRRLHSGKGPAPKDPA